MLLIVLLAHLTIVEGEILVLEALGLIDDAGVCITHPSMPIAALAVVNPLAGLVALANFPLVVTPRS